jgi:hypothetical protein
MSVLCPWPYIYWQPPLIDTLLSQQHHHSLRRPSNIILVCMYVRALPPLEHLPSYVLRARRRWLDPPSRVELWEDLSALAHPISSRRIWSSTATTHLLIEVMTAKQQVASPALARIKSPLSFENPYFLGPCSFPFLVLLSQGCIWSWWCESISSNNFILV